ncbi:NAD(P)-dependent oxidoreductase [Kribbella sp. NPDC000426]|uniref:NAD(P)-dependent oxidoreductase n=1 Tax=Kribbella sp. NPDC000426 TaxID=3154255 RepID=UPI003322ECF6
MEIALVGAGRIGLAVARQLVAHGHAIRVHDVRPEVESQVRAFGAAWGEPRAETDLLVTVLPGSPELRAEMLGDHGLLSRLRRGSSWLDLTSASPALGAELAVAAADDRIDYLETPVGGGPDAAASGELTVYAAGEVATFERLEPIVRAFAGKVHYTGPHGSGYLTKLLVNLLWFSQVVAVGEVLMLGRSGGLDPSRLRQILLEGPAASAFLEDVLPRMLAGDQLATFGLDRIVEELDSIEEFARLHHVPAGLAALVGSVHRDALSRFGPIDGELLAITHLEHLWSDPLDEV